MYRFAMLPVLVALGACGTLEEEQGKCMKWKTVEVTRKEFLPYPIDGYVERTQTHLICLAREEENDTVALRRPAI